MKEATLETDDFHESLLKLHPIVLKLGFEWSLALLVRSRECFRDVSGVPELFLDGRGDADLIGFLGSVESLVEGFDIHMEKSLMV